ncbi:hypothetical protein ACLOJK_027504 [Asimina triloba]
MRLFQNPSRFHLSLKLLSHHATGDSKLPLRRRERVAALFLPSAPPRRDAWKTLVPPAMIKRQQGEVSEAFFGLHRPSHYGS